MDEVRELHGELWTVVDNYGRGEEGEGGSEGEGGGEGEWGGEGGGEAE